ncbi:hypothetical protein Gotur_002490 [Gossypium turneri]
MQAFDSLMYTVTLDWKLILAFCIRVGTPKKRTRKEYKVVRLGEAGRGYYITSPGWSGTSQEILGQTKLGVLKMEEVGNSRGEE